MWEAANGKIPRDSIIIFRDGDRQNVNIDNLIMIKKAVNAVLNHTELGTYAGEAKETAVKIAELKIATSQAKKRRKVCQ